MIRGRCPYGIHGLRIRRYRCTRSRSRTFSSMAVMAAPTAALSLVRTAVGKPAEGGPTRPLRWRLCVHVSILGEQFESVTPGR